MAEFNLVGTPEPFLHVSLRQGEKIYCESDAMVMMESNLELGGNLRGGLFQSVMRKFTTGESLFQQEIKASFGAGECLLSPNLDGDMQILNIGQQQYVLSDGAFVASTEQVNVKAKVQTNLGGSLFGDNGGFVVMETSGQGQLCISGCGTLMEVEVNSQNGETVIDNGHVVAWDSSLNYSIGMPSSRNRGMFGNLLNSVTSGEGMVLKFQGYGKVIICSRNRNSYITWLASVLNLGQRS
ncbi:TIGR00266 family protein [Acinetobacter brisouii]|uniref:TIGR00266 family protein n=1 Tax=Acinetobacter brisouii CIP 110357 TaxID=1341683 RepID=V2USI3_9GAMM|nr:TIGR00266 family protein [Acinetobacter brisouii]ENV48563.1 TIGR00266 family protein [Acinetobacter brisouii ANC 4119]ESK52962.1 hypothetical protein P255_00065 [Acinetobacter brisouii CIP 110357]